MRHRDRTESGQQMRGLSQEPNRHHGGHPEAGRALLLQVLRKVRNKGHSRNRRN